MTDTIVLIVDDDPALARALSINLRAHDYDAIVADTGKAALAAVADLVPAVVILDIGLPDIDGITVLRSIRTWTTVPVIMLSARTTSQEKVEALDAGADDYVTKPFNTAELLARIRAAARRVKPATEPPTQAVITDDFTVDLDDRRVWRNGTLVRLTPTEWSLLEMLVRNAGKIVTGQQLLTEVWGTAASNEYHYLRVYLAQLRRKLEPDPSHPKYLITERSIGYRFDVPRQ